MRCTHIVCDFLTVRSRHAPVQPSLEPPQAWKSRGWSRDAITCSAGAIDISGGSIVRRSSAFCRAIRGGGDDESSSSQSRERPSLRLFASPFVLTIEAYGVFHVAMELDDPLHRQKALTRELSRSAIVACKTHQEQLKQRSKQLEADLKALTYLLARIYYML